MLRADNAPASMTAATRTPRSRRRGSRRSRSRSRSRSRARTRSRSPPRSRARSRKRSRSRSGSRRRRSVSPKKPCPPGRYPRRSRSRGKRVGSRTYCEPYSTGSVWDRWAADRNSSACPRGMVRHPVHVRADGSVDESAGYICRDAPAAELIGPEPRRRRSGGRRTSRSLSFA